MEKKKKIKKEIIQWTLSIVAAIFLSLGLRSYVFASVDVDGSSMQPTLNNKDKIFVEKISLHTQNIKRGQIVIFDSKDSKNDIFVKRVIAVEGDEVELKDGKVFVNDEEIKEPYLEKNTITNPGTYLKKGQKIKINKDYIFVLGDNRSVSLDSRFLGLISIKDLKGHVIFRAYPFNSIKGF